MKATTDTMNRHDSDKPIRKVEGVILTRSQCGWQVEKLPIHGCRIVDNTGRIVAADIYDELLAQQIVDEHNSHTALVEQRDRALTMASDAQFAHDQLEDFMKQRMDAANRLADKLLRERDEVRERCDKLHVVLLRLTNYVESFPGDIASGDELRELVIISRAVLNEQKGGEG